MKTRVKFRAKSQTQLVCSEKTLDSDCLFSTPDVDGLFSRVWMRSWLTLWYKWGWHNWMELWITTDRATNGPNFRGVREMVLHWKTYTCGETVFSREAANKSITIEHLQQPNNDCSITIVYRGDFSSMYQSFRAVSFLSCALFYWLVV